MIDHVITSECKNGSQCHNTWLVRTKLVPTLEVMQKMQAHEKNFERNILFPPSFIRSSGHISSVNLLSGPFCFLTHQEKFLHGPSFIERVDNPIAKGVGYSSLVDFLVLVETLCCFCSQWCLCNSLLAPPLVFFWPRFYYVVAKVGGHIFPIFWNRSREGKWEGNSLLLKIRGRGREMS